MNLKTSMKKFLGNKNTVTILGVVLCLIILYIGYNWRINSQVELVQVPYAKETIQPRTYITEDMIAIKSVPKAFLAGSSYYSNAIMGSPACFSSRRLSSTIS